MSCVFYLAAGTRVLQFLLSVSFCLPLESMPCTSFSYNPQLLAWKPFWCCSKMWERERAFCNLQIKYQRFGGPVSELWPYQMSPFGYTSAWSPLLPYMDTYFLTWLQHLQSFFFFFFLLWFLLTMFYVVLFFPLGVIRRLEELASELFPSSIWETGSELHSVKVLSHE